MTSRQDNTVLNRAPDQVLTDLSSDRISRTGITYVLLLFLKAYVHSKEMQGGSEKVIHSLVNKDLLSVY